MLPLPEVHDGVAQQDEVHRLALLLFHELVAAQEAVGPPVVAEDAGIALRVLRGRLHLCGGRALHGRLRRAKRRQSAHGKSHRARRNDADSLHFCFPFLVEAFWNAIIIPKPAAATQAAHRPRAAATPTTARGWNLRELDRHHDPTRNVLRSMPPRRLAPIQSNHML